MVSFLNSSEAMDYLGVSNWKLRKLIDEGRLTPKVTKSKFNYKKGAYIYNPFELAKIKRELREEGYEYKYA